MAEIQTIEEKEISFSISSLGKIKKYDYEKDNGSYTVYSVGEWPRIISVGEKRVLAQQKYGSIDEISLYSSPWILVPGYVTEEHSDSKMLRYKVRFIPMEEQPSISGAIRNSKLKGPITFWPV
jgi:hypothetical protein